MNSLEIDFLPVGEESKCGDAIALRFGHCENGQWENQTIVIIDGGNKDSGDALVSHVQNVYNSDTVDRVILTHPDADHASGLRTVIEELGVGKIWMHCPWNHWDDLKDTVKDGRITKKSFNNSIQEAYQFAYEIEGLAKKKGIEIYAPHQGCHLSSGSEKILTVLGPSKELYLSLIQASGKTPNMGVFESARESASISKKMAYEDMTPETEHLCDQDAQTSAENDMSLILLLTVANSKVLFTGDAGTQGLFKAISYATQQGISLKDLDVLDVPHHGSRHNLSKGILKYINAKYSIISCSKKGWPRHPSPIVVNSLLRREMESYQTNGRMLNFRSGKAPLRPEIGPVSAIPFTNFVQIPVE